MPILTHVDASMNRKKCDVESDDDAIVISGVSGRFPESNNIQEFQDNLFNNFDMVTDDSRRWKSGIYGLPARSGKLKELSKFDAMFFSVHAKQAHVMDPQLRLLLELTHEAIIDAGYNPCELRGSKTGVFVGISGNESDEYWTSDPDKINGYGLTGCCRAMFPNRISYTFDFNGPSYAIDTACSSSLFALEQAFTAIRNGQCDSAIVGGVNLLLKPMTSLQFHRLNMLSMDGKCKAFDASGNGYVRAEAAATILLQKKHAARRIYSYVLNAKTNMDGYKVQGITFPSGAMQSKLIKEVYAEININPNQVEYVEAHGTGTKVGDPQEVNSIAEIFCKDRKNSLLIGSVKSNMGHSEPASGLCSIAKMLIAMHSRIIPANLHFKQPNADISALTDGRLTVVDKNTNWSLGLVGVNSFGFGGANAHIILKPFKTKNDNSKNTITSLKPLALVSGRTESAVKHFLESLKTNSSNELYHLVNKIHSINIPNHGYRGFLLDSVMEISAINATDARPVWFVFSGMGTQWSHMARDMMSIPLFRASIEKCAKVLSSYKINLMKILTDDPDEVFDNVLNSFISIASIQIALTDILREMKIYPDGIVGHSIGEIGCAYADQTFTTEQAMLTAYFRGCAILDSKLSPGAMAAVGLSWEECKKRCPPEIQPACHNSNDSVTISGPPAQLEAFTAQLTSENIFAKVVKSSNVAFHSKYIKEAGPKLRKALEKIIKVPKKRSSKWISSSIPQDKWSDPIAKYSSVDYHVNNLLSPVLFRDALTHVPDNAIVIEIAPHCLLQAILKRSLVDKTVQNIGLMKRDAKNNVEYFLSAIGKLYNCGLQPDINILYPPVSYPLGPEVNMLASMVQWDHTTDWSVPEFSGANSKSSEMVIEVDLSKDSDKFIAGHQIDGRILFPATGYLTLVWKCFAKLFQKEFEDIPVIFNNVNFHRATIMPKEGPIKFLINIFHISGQFELCESGAIVVSGQIQQIPDENLDSDFLPLTIFPINEEKQFTLVENDIYKELRLRGYDYSNEFRGIQNSNLTSNFGHLKWTGTNWISFMDTMLQFGILGRNTRELYLPTRLQRAIIDPKRHVTKYGTETTNIEVYMAHDINVIRAGSIEFRGLKASLAPRRQLIQSEPKLEKYEWVAYDFSHNNRFLPIDSLTILLQIAIENSNGALKFKIMEILESAEEPLMGTIVSILEAEPMIYVNGFIMNLNNLNKIENNMENIKVVTKLENNCNLIIDLNSYDVTELEKCLKPGGMILTNSYKDFKDYQIMACSEQYYLLRKPVEIDFADSKIIYVNNNDDNTYKWINEIKTAMTSVTENQTSRIFLVSYNQTSGIIGLVNCLKQEAAGDRLRLYFLAESNMKFSLNDEQLKQQLELDLLINIYKGTKWGSYRHIVIDSKIGSTKFQVEHAYVNTLTRGDLSSLKWIEGPLSFYNEGTNGSELCYVYYAPLNFRDIMLATGKLPPDALPGDLAGQDCVLGLEFSGRMAQNGERVMGMLAARGLATTVITDSSFLWKIPEKWSLEEAATIPIVYGTSYYALIVRGRMRAGESVLIHAGSGGVGQAAIAIALHMNCTVFTTVGSQAKRDFLKQRFPKLSDQYIGNSRDCSFEQMILKQTHGRGVDLILNSLADDKLQASVRCLAKDGRFLEIGKVDLSNNSPLGMAVFLKNITFHGILLDALFEAHSDDKKQVMQLVSDGIQNGAVQPLPSTVFQDNQIESAFRFMASGKHIGKVLIKVRDEEPSRKSIKPETKLIVAIPKTYMNPEKSYIIIGGLGGFGLELTNWMIKRGAKKLVLTSRSGIRTGYQALCTSRWNSMGISVEISKLDCTKENQAQELLNMTNNKFGPVGGIFNLAAVLRDAMIDHQTEQDFKVVCEPKTIATVYLDKYSQELCPQLDYFVVFSSVSCGRGNAGQSNYGYANSVMERICEQRQLQGLPAKAIQWGAIGDVGLILDAMNGSNDLEVGGTVPQRINSCLETIDYFLQRHEPVVASMVLAEKRSKTSDKGAAGSPASLIEAISNILGIKNIQGISMSTTLADLGMDSLMGSEIKQTLERNYDLLLNAQEIRNLTFSKLLEMTKNESDNDQTVPVITNGVDSIETNGYSNGYAEKNIHFGMSGLLMPTQSLVLMNECKSVKNVLFLLHPIEGTVEVLEELSNNMPKNVAVYGLQFTKEAPQDTINELAQYYIHKIQEIQAHGPYKLCGYSFGACVAFEMALQLQQLNEQVHLVLLDGSHMYVTMHTQKSRKSTKNDTDYEQCEVLAYFVMQFTDFDAQKIVKELLLLPDWDTRATRAAEYVSKEKVVPIDIIKTAALSLYKKLYAAECYKPKLKFNGPTYLIRAKDNYVQMADDYGLSNVCKLPIQITELEGNHRTILQGKSAQQITNIIMQLF